ncbi:MAG TPA: hypothetical protein VFZ01_03345 [Geminicoccaceae bacterium]
MLEQIAHWQDELLRAPPEVVVPAAIFLIVLLLRLALAVPGRSRSPGDDGLEAEAWRWINERIDEHVDELAEAYAGAGPGGNDDELPPGFAPTIESFIAEVLLREQDADDVDVDLRAAVREVLVLHRAELYEDVAMRTRDHLAAA